MIIEQFSAFAAIVLAVSLATERLVAFAKSALPTWLADEKKTDASEVDLLGDRGRRIRVHAVALVSAWIASASLAEPGFSLIGKVAVGSGSAALPVPLLAFLSMGGSAFWTNIVGYASAAKDLRVQERSRRGLDFQAEAKRMGRLASDAGIAAVPRRASGPATDVAKVAGTITSLTQPGFDIPASRVVTHG
jgi:hypothetical protein